MIRLALAASTLALVYLLTLPPPVAQTPATTSPDARRAALVDYAVSLLGMPYVRGGRSATGGDCSGTMQHIYLTVAGIDIGATTFSQYPQLQPIDEADLLPGDLWFGQYATDQHVGLVADIDGDQRWDLVNNGGLADDLHIDYSFMDMPYFYKHTMGFRRAL
jgi:cell wall-associated NlpC family hydrolase